MSDDKCKCGPRQYCHLDNCQGGGAEITTCTHCGRTCRDPEGGYGSVGSAPLCHPNVPLRPDCYRLVTVYGHQLHDCPKCKLSDASKALPTPAQVQP